MKLRTLFYLLVVFLIAGFFQVNAAENLGEKLKGRILLQVEASGEAWYVYPVDLQRYYLGRPADAFRVMRELGLGISESSYNSFRGVAPERLSGRILLRVENNGEAYYVNPTDRKMHYLGRPADAFRVMRELGLGITNANLNQVAVSEIENVKLKTLIFINDYMLAGDTKAEIVEIKKEGELYFASFLIGGNNVKSYVTDDLAYFFPQFFIIENVSIDSNLEAETAATAFIVENNMIKTGFAVKADGMNEYGIYELSINVENSDSVINAGITKNGVFFPSIININEAVKLSNEGAVLNNDYSDPVVTETEKPFIELFVMSHCPYGVQMEKGLIPVLETLGDKVNFELKFVNYAMHGEKEVYEQLTQYCVQKNEPEKLLDYLECFVLDGDQGRCLVEASINTGILGQCKAETDMLHGISADLGDKSTWSGNFPPFSIYEADCDKYSVLGSPTLVINGKIAQSQRDSQSLLSTVCGYFDTEPSECSSQLEGTSPSPGFGEYGYSATSAATCN